MCRSLVWLSRFLTELGPNVTGSAKSCGEKVGFTGYQKSAFASVRDVESDSRSSASLTPSNPLFVKPCFQLCVPDFLFPAKRGHISPISFFKFLMEPSSLMYASTTRDRFSVLASESA